MDKNKTATGRKIFLLLAAVVILGEVIYLYIQNRTPDVNFLVILTDTVRADKLGCYGNDRGLTPNIDELARTAVQFERAYSHSPWTLPSVASLYTSRLPGWHGAGGHVGEFTMLPEAALTLAEVFQRAGLQTAAVANVMFLGEAFGLDQGFDHIDMYGPKSNTDLRDARATTDVALQWLEENGDDPFFLLVHFFDAHLVYDPPKEFREKFAAPGDADSDDYLFGVRDDMLALRSGRITLDEVFVRRLEMLYDGEVAYVDSQVGRLLERLEDMDLTEKTVVVVVSDHGEEFYDHGGFEHGHTLYNELLHVPLLIKVPAKIREGLEGLKTDRTARIIDVAATLSALAGLEQPSSFQGLSLLPLLEGEPEERIAIAQGNMWGPSGMSLQQNSHKLIYAASPSQLQLYDIEDDPRELKNLVDEAPKIRKNMMRQMQSIIESSPSEASAEIPALSDREMERLRSLGYAK